jgi:RNA polymerase sigma-70 factor (ECF subfamily)
MAVHEKERGQAMLWQPWDDSQLTAEVAGLRRYARRLVGGDPDRAEDLVQECLLRAVSRRHRFQADSNLRAWLTTMMRNIYIDHQRREDRRSYSLAANFGGRSDGMAPNQEWAVALSETRRHLGELPHRDREIIDMTGLQGMSTQEAASALHLPIGTVKSRLSRARRRLPDVFRPTGS